MDIYLEFFSEVMIWRVFKYLLKIYLIHVADTDWSVCENNQPIEDISSTKSI